MTHDQVQQWLDGYIAAWASNDGEDIGALFTEDVVYSYRPWIDDKVAVHGRDAVVAAWTSSEEDPDIEGAASWEASYTPYVLEGNRAVATGWSKYVYGGEKEDRLYHNAFLMEFDDDGRCSSFREFWFLDGK